GARGPRGQGGGEGGGEWEPRGGAPAAPSGCGPRLAADPAQGPRSPEHPPGRQERPGRRVIMVTTADGHTPVPATPGHIIRFASWERVSTEDRQDPESSRAWRYARGKSLIEPHGALIPPP